MLTLLRVKNLALVEDATAEFGPGLDVITGETGAGKSILVGALNLVMGERAEKGLIRSGTECCQVEAVFQLDDAAAVDAVLQAAGMEPCPDGQLLIRRTVKSEGAGQILINDAPATLQTLRKAGDLLVDLHGPHDHQSLLRPDFQRDMLDAFAHAQAERTQYQQAYAQWQAALARRAELSAGVADLDGQLDLLRFRVKEIADAAPVEGEEEQIREEHAVAGHAQRILELGNAVVGALQEEESSAFDALVRAQKAMEELSRLMPKATEWLEETRRCASGLRELTLAVSSAMERVEADPARLDWLDQRLATYDRLKRKYGPTVPEILAVLAQSRQRLQDLETRDEQLAALEKELAKLAKETQRQGLTLRAKRQEAAGKLAAAITRELRTLGFEHGTCAVQLREAEPAPGGLDEIEFGFAPNQGEPMQPLRAIASSGEISRVMLALKVVLADHDRIPVLVFDEIDANVGGEIGNAVGKKLAQVARHRQVICITHLPQVAVHGTHHFAVRKSVRQGRTFTQVQALGAEDRPEEIARMLGGKDLTTVTLRHAREMLAAAAR